MNKRAQSTLELTLSFIVILMLLSGAIRVFIWSVRSTVLRHNAYMQNYSENFNNPDEFYHPGRIGLVPGVVSPDPGIPEPPPAPEEE